MSMVVDGRRGGLRARRLARQLAELSRLEKGLEPCVPGHVDLARMLAALCSDYPGVELRAEAPREVLTDSRHLAAALFPILDNALLHGSAPVLVELQGNEVSVADAGPGFPEGLLARATEKFVTGSPARGVGLGLAIAAAHARLIGATIRPVNERSGGARVSLLLPDPLPRSRAGLAEAAAGL